MSEAESRNVPGDAPRDAPGVIAPPPLIYGGFLALGAALEWLWPTDLLPAPLRLGAGGAAILAALAIAAWAIGQFRRAGTNLDVRKPVTALVISGPFRYSRNPIYLALTLLYLGIGVAADSAWVLALVVPALLVMQLGVVRREERYLSRKFGQKYLTYMGAVRRWL